ncbi:MAG: hypothetical protein IPK73_23275 [Candidatus Obscuribacter sp.]|nr:hypothetical protein [Candidatus Obscuribacter sp.]MBK9277035.1 hypothetical protein [Candidatus Obscuribacter sp.]
MKCIYCLEQMSKPGREHVIPRSLGTFESNSPILRQVCATCNGELSKLETVFKEDSFEGMLAAQYKVKKSRRARLRNDRLRWSLEVGGDNIFGHIFPSFDSQSKKAIPEQQIVVVSANGKKEVIWTKNLAESEILDKLQWRPKDHRTVYIFAESTEEHDRLKGILQKVGVKFRHDALTLGDSMDETSEVFAIIEGTIDKDIRRTISKIALNYLAFCAFESDCGEIVLQSEFDAIRDFILNSASQIDNPVSVEPGAMTNDEFAQLDHNPFHFFEAYENLHGVYVAMSLFGHLKYSVRLADPLFSKLGRGGFGIRHLFNTKERYFGRAFTKADCDREHKLFDLFCIECPRFMMDLEKDFKKLGSSGESYLHLANRIENSFIHEFSIVLDAARKQNCVLAPPYFVTLVMIQDGLGVFLEGRSNYRWAIPLEHLRKVTKEN